MTAKATPPSGKTGKRPSSLDGALENLRRWRVGPRAPGSRAPRPLPKTQTGETRKARPFARKMMTVVGGPPALQARRFMPPASNPPLQTPVGCSEPGACGWFLRGPFLKPHPMPSHTERAMRSERYTGIGRGDLGCRDRIPADVSQSKWRRRGLILSSRTRPTRRGPPSGRPRRRCRCGRCPRCRCCSRTGPS